MGHVPLLTSESPVLLLAPSPFKMGSHGVQFVLELSAIVGGLLTPLLKCWEYRYVLSHLTYVVPRTEPRASCSPESPTPPALNPVSLYALASISEDRAAF